MSHTLFNRPYCFLFQAVIRVSLIHVKTMAFVDESRATNIIANALQNIMEQTVNVSKTQTQALISINRGRNHFYILDRKFYILLANLNFFKGIEVII